MNYDGMSLVNAMTPIDLVRPGAHVVLDNVVYRVESNLWSRACTWWELTLEGYPEPLHYYDDAHLHTVRVVFRI
ncbi:hypothetical protein OPTIMUS_195 [Mycobacterium phage Optimus]|uniref:Uncharacterized protein n=3 Tax=Omegavirus TaxID=1623292 RepID=G8I5Q9_9CAUD|nr:hypothetical protein N860_gp215 [Mycobacterium phage Redno2]YP_009012101.1 hypothetical protein CM09_gp220 [Mycobacterium phage Courthouse]YP_009205335.1 hypothetical protein AVT17_gp225 [Mycobacterium phage Ariel]YP_009213425.1 hypothetical protein AVV70_gp229 [Mycobacterium phage MiaZeal]YP_009591050.1 hypothetical protein FDG54_gp218 [Mycobacterium phage Optimus]ASZ74272.1 hypothetical protein SEA_SQUINT_197 [Mycobacterium phage Squint]ATS93038.1 hypothetical protein SEA_SUPERPHIKIMAN_2